MFLIKDEDVVIDFFEPFGDFRCRETAKLCNLVNLYAAFRVVKVIFKKQQQEIIIRLTILDAI